MSAGRIDLPPSLDDGKVVEGRDGRLFVANDGNRVLDQHTGRLLFDAAQLRHWRHLLETRTAWLARRGAAHRFLIPPDAHAVYPDMLPPRIEPAARRPVHQIIDDLREHDSYACVLYPLEAVAAGRDRHAFPRTGSHWSSLGAFLAYRALAEDLAGDVGLAMPALEDWEVVETEVPGDLGAKLDPPAASTWVHLEARRPDARIVADNRVRNAGRRIDFEGGKGGGGSCFVYGESFGVRMLPFMAESFRRLTYVHMTTLDFDLVRELQPDVVVGVLAERACIVPPVDVGAQTQRELEARKVAVGDLIPVPPHARAGAGRGPAPPA